MRRQSLFQGQSRAAERAADDHLKSRLSGPIAGEMGDVLKGGCSIEDMVEELGSLLGKR